MAKFGEDQPTDLGKATQFRSDNQPANNGRKKKSFRLLIDECKAKGYEAVTKEQLVEVYAFLYSLEQSEIEEIAEDDKQPLALRLIIREMTDERSSGKTLADFRDFMFGKAMQHVEAKTETTFVLNETKQYVADDKAIDSP
jgi:hypothetical protein